MRILADENLAQSIIDHLVSGGHEVIDARRGDLAGASDDELYRRAVEERLTIVTMDRDFMRMTRFPPQACGGIVVARIYRRTPPETLRLFRECFDNLSEDTIRGNLVIITPGGMRIRGG